MLYLFDLDDTLISGYMSNADKNYNIWKVLPSRQEKLDALRATHHPIGIVTNQAGVAWGHITEGDVRYKLHQVAQALGFFGLEIHDGGVPHRTGPPFAPSGGQDLLPVWVCYNDKRGSDPRYRFDGRRKPSGAMIREAAASYGDDARIYAALRAGALGYLLKNVACDALLQAVRGAARGEPQLHPEVARRLMQQVAPPADPLAALSPREREVLRRLARGKSNKEIAAVLGLAVETVKGHVSDILAALHVADRTQAALLAVRYGLVRFDQDIEP